MKRWRLVVGIAAFVAVVVLVRVFGLADYLSLENLGRLRDYINSFGAAAPVIFILGYALATVAFLPGTPFTLLGGLAFGPVLGAVYATIGATLGAVLAFLVARYFARGVVGSWVSRDERLQRIDDGVECQGWRMLVITRLVPLFPFNLQNYAYGLTKIGLATYTLVTAICIIPAVVVYTFAGGSLTTAGENLTRTFIYLGIAAVVFVLLSLIPGFIRRRSREPSVRRDRVK